MVALKTQLTDEMLVEAMEKTVSNGFVAEIISFIIIGFLLTIGIIIVALIVRLYILHKSDNKRKANFFTAFILAVYFLGMTGKLVYIFYDNSEQKKNIDGWYVIESRIYEIEKDTWDKARNKSMKRRHEKIETFYYAKIVDAEGEVSINNKEDIEKFEIGDKVYALVDSKGTVHEIYGNKTYEYVGERMKK